MNDLIRVLRSLCSDEEGTALTEFIITLPVFVLTFIFLANMQSYHITLNRVRFVAATNMWDAAVAVQTGNAVVPPDPHGLPSIAAADALSIVGGSPSFAGDAQQTAIIGGLAGGRSGEEMRAGAQIVGHSMQDPASETSLTFASSIAEDGMSAPQSASGPVGDYFNPARIPSVNPIATRHAAILGTRYGAVSGSHTGVADARTWGSLSITAQYDTLVSPVSYPGDLAHEYFIVGTSRLLAEEDPCLSSVLEISWGFKSC